MMSDSPQSPSLGIIAIRIASEPQCLEQLLPALRKSTVRLIESDSPENAVQEMKEFSGCLILACISDKTQLVPVLSFLSSITPTLKAGTSRAIVICQMDHPKIPPLLKSKGASEVCLYSLTSKALSYKIQQSFQLIQKKLDHSKSAEPNSVRDWQKSSSSAAAPDQLESVTWTEPLKTQSDCWLFDAHRGIKNVLGRWLLEVMGPSPSAGTWEKFQNLWKWVPRDSAVNAFTDPNEGNWFFSGRVPEFVWKINRWRLVGDRPILFFTDHSGVQSFKIQVQSDGRILLANNSPQAESKRQAMEATFSSDYHDEATRTKTKDDLSLELTDETPKPDWHEEESPDDLAAQWGEQLTQEENAQDWNEHDLGEEEDARDWNGTDLTRQNIYNHGRGIGLGTKSEISKKDDWLQGSEAFESLKLLVTCKDENQTPLEILEYENLTLLIDPGTRRFELRQPFVFRVFAAYGVMVQFDFYIQAEVIEICETIPEMKSNIRIKVAAEEFAKLEKLYGALRKRQDQIFKFLREARGF